MKTIETVNEKIRYQKVSEKKTSEVYLVAKRAFDIILSVTALILLSPVFLIVMLAIKLQDGGSPFYSQTRCGKNEKVFKMYKFRSMCMNADQKLRELQELNKRDGPVFKIDDDPRITKVGKFIRKTCIDELPQLFNILKGDMSIVGPRPPLVSEVEQYSDYDKKRLSVTPGLTCIWQVNKTKETSFAQWVEMDLEYIKTRSLAKDITLIFSTFKVVLSFNGDK